MAIFGMTQFQLAVIIAMATNVLWITIFLFFKFKTHAFTEIGAWIKGKSLLLLDTGNKYQLISAEDETGSGALKSPKVGTFIKTPYSMKTFGNTGANLAVAVTKSAFIITPDIGLLSQLAYETKKNIIRKYKNTPEYDNKGNLTGIKSEELPNLQNEAEKDAQKLLEIQGITEVEKEGRAKVSGITVNFDQVTHFFKQLSPSSVDAKIELTIANRLAKERHALSFQNVMLIVMLLMGAAIAFVIIKNGGINTGTITAAVKQAISSTSANSTVIKA